MTPPNLILVVTDQQRSPQHWPEDPAWLDRLMPNDAELRRTGMSFDRAFIASAMCSPSRASLLTGTFPARHGVRLTLTYGDLFPDRRHAPDALRTAVGIARSGEVPRARVASSFLRGALRIGRRSGNEPELPAGFPTLATRLRELGYHVALKGKWHLTKPVTGEWSPADAERVERDHGFADWDPTDAGGDAKARSFGGGNAGRSGHGWDEDYTRQMEAWFAASRSRSPSASSGTWSTRTTCSGTRTPSRRGATTSASSPTSASRCRPPSTRPPRQADRAGAHEDRSDRLPRRAARPRAAAALCRLLRPPASCRGWPPRPSPAPAGRRGRPRLAAGPDGGRAHLRPRGAGPVARRDAPEDVQRLRGGPPRAPRRLEPGALRRPAPVGRARLARGHRPDPARPGRRRRRSDPVLAGHDLGPLLRGERERVRDAVLFTYDDHQAGTAFQDAPGQPNRIRCVRDDRFKYAVYLDPRGRVAPEYELYDLDADPDEVHNLVEVATGEPRTAIARRELARLQEALAGLCAEAGVLSPALPQPAGRP